MFKSYVFRCGKLFGTSFSCSFNAIVDAVKSNEKAHKLCDHIKVGEYHFVNSTTDRAIVYALNGEQIGLIEIQMF